MVTVTARGLISESSAKIEIGRRTLWGTGFVIAGLLLAALAVYLNFLVDPSRPVGRSAAQLFFEMLILVGMAFFSMGLFSVILDLKSWKDYFEAGLRRIVLQPEYLKTLSPERLREHQVDIFKTYYSDSDIDHEGRFLRYCLEHIHRYLMQPYRERIYDKITVKPAGPSLFRVTDKLTYACRRIDGSIQSRVFWQANSREVLKMEDLRVQLRWPRGHKEADRRVILGIQDLTEKQLHDGSLLFEYDLSQHRQVDGLVVEAEATYLVHDASFNTWRMADPSRDVELRISYPTDLKIQFLPYLIDHDPDEVQDDPGLFIARFKSWIMPKSGFAWKLLPVDLPDKVQLGGEGTWAESLADVLDDAAD